MFVQALFLAILHAIRSTWIRYLSSDLSTVSSLVSANGPYDVSYDAHRKMKIVTMTLTERTAEP